MMLAFPVVLVALRIWAQAATRHRFTLHGQTLTLDDQAFDLDAGSIRSAAGDVWVGPHRIHLRGHPRSTRAWFADRLREAAVGPAPETPGERHARVAVQGVVETAQR